MRQLVARGDQVTSFSRGDYPELAALGVRCLRGDITDRASVVAAAAGVDAIIHTAAKAGIWGAYSSYHGPNVLGTQHVIAAARHHGITRIVHTSSPSVTFDGKDQDGVDESVPYASRNWGHYPVTKAISERDMLHANGPQLATVALRPHLIWGPGDPHFRPLFVKKAREGRLFLIDKGEQLVDSVHVENAAHAHILALERLAPGSPIQGKAFFITNHEPWPIRRLIAASLKAAGIEFEARFLPKRLVYALGTVCESSWRTLALKSDPPVTRFMARQLGTSHWYDPRAARSLLGYEPKLSMDEGMLLLLNDPAS